MSLLVCQSYRSVLAQYPNSAILTAELPLKEPIAQPLTGTMSMEATGSDPKSTFPSSLPCLLWGHECDNSVS